jgi:hypothetical protein
VGARGRAAAFRFGAHPRRSHCAAAVDVARGSRVARCKTRALHSSYDGRGAEFERRRGYSFRGTGDDRSPLTLGGGVTLGRFSVDYAYEGFDLLGGATHRFGVRYAAAMRGS